MLYAMIRADYWENIEIYIDGMINAGTEFQVFGMSPFSGQVGAGVKYYF